MRGYALIVLVALALSGCQSTIGPLLGQADEFGLDVQKGLQETSGTFFDQTMEYQCNTVRIAELRKRLKTEEQRANYEARCEDYMEYRAVLSPAEEAAVTP